MPDGITFESAERTLWCHQNPREFVIDDLSEALPALLVSVTEH